MARVQRDPLGWRNAIADFLRAIHGEAAPRTEQFYGQRLGILAAWAEGKAERGEGVALEDFKARDMRAFMADRADLINPATQKKLAISTRRSDAIAARVFFRFCVREDYLSRDPLIDYKILKAERAYVPAPSDDEAARLLRAVVDRWNPIKNPKAAYLPKERRTFFARRNFGILATLIQTGLRISEVFALTLADYRPDERHIVVRRSKGKEWRAVPLEGVLMDALDEYLRVRPALSPSDFLFVTDAGLQMDVRSFRRGWYKDREFAGLPDYSLHSLRHFSLTCLAEVNKWGAQQIAGHKDGRVTDGYLHGNQAHLQQVMAEAAPLSRLLVNKRSEKARRARLV